MHVHGEPSSARSPLELKEKIFSGGGGSGGGEAGQQRILICGSYSESHNATDQHQGLLVCILDIKT